MTIDLKQGDCLNLMSNIEDKSIDMILCDLPYGTTENYWDRKINLAVLWAKYERIIKDNGAIVLFSQMPFTAEVVMSNQKLFRYEWIWIKNSGTGFLNAKRMPLKIHENILVFYKKLPIYNPQKREGEPYVKTKSEKTSTCYKKAKPVTTESKGGRFPIDVVKFSKSKDRKAHATQKPIDLLEYLIKTYTNEHDIVLDNCMGSGSTGVACVNLNRNFIGMEIDETFFDVACERIERAKKEKENTLWEK